MYAHKVVYWGNYFDCLYDHDKRKENIHHLMSYNTISIMNIHLPLHSYTLYMDHLENQQNIYLCEIYSTAIFFFTIFVVIYGKCNIFLLTYSIKKYNICCWNIFYLILILYAKNFWNLKNNVIIWITIYNSILRFFFVIKNMIEWNVFNLF